MYDDYYDTYDLEERSLAAGSAESSDDKPAVDEAAEAEEKEAGDTSVQTYTVVSGDSLWNIAQDKYGDGEKWRVIYDANKDAIRDPGLIFPGQELEIPNAA